MLFKIFKRVLESLNEKIAGDELLETMANQKTTSKFITLRIEEILKEFADDGDLKSMCAELDEGIKNTEIKISHLDSQNERLLAEISEAANEKKKLEFKIIALSQELNNLKMEQSHEEEVRVSTELKFKEEEISRLKCMSLAMQDENSTLLNEKESLVKVLQNLSFKLLGTKSFDRNILKMTSKIDELNQGNKEEILLRFNLLKKKNSALKKEIREFKIDLEVQREDLKTQFWHSQKAIEKRIHTTLSEFQLNSSLKERQTQEKYLVQEENSKEEIKNLKFQISSLTKKTSIYSEELESITKSLTKETREKENSTQEREVLISNLLEKEQQTLAILNSKIKELNQIKSENSDFQNQIECLESKFAKYKKDSEMAISLKSDEINNLLQKFKAQEENRERLQFELEMMNKSYKTSVNEIEALNRIIEENCDQNLIREENLNTEIRSLKSKYQNLTEKYSKIEEENISFEENFRTQKIKLDNLFKENFQLQQEISALNSETKKFNENLEEFKLFKRQFNTEKSKIINQINEKEQNENYMKDQLKILFEELSECKKKFRIKLQSLENQISNSIASQNQSFEHKKSFDHRIVDSLQNQNEELQAQLSELIQRYEQITQRREEEKRKFLSELEIAYKSRSRENHQIPKKDKTPIRAKAIQTENESLKDKIKELKKLNTTLSVII